MKSKSFRAVIAFLVGALLLACSDRTHLPVDAHPTQSSNANVESKTSPSGTLPLKVVADTPLSGGTTRVYWPLLNVGGKAVLRITAPTHK